MKHRVAVITGIPAPYREPVFERLAARPDVDLAVYYCAKAHGNVAWQAEAGRNFTYPREIVPNWSPKRFQRLPFFGYANLGLARRLQEFAPTYVIVYGYNQLAHWLAFHYCLANNVPFALRSDSNVHIDLSDSWQSAVRRRLLRWLIQRAAAVLPVGSANAAYWRSFGADDRRIHLAPYAIDNAKVAELAGRRRPDPDGRIRFLYVGRLIPRKGVDLLISAYNRIANDRTHLTIVGDGADRAALAASQSPAAARRTTWLGKLGNSEALRSYGAADVFILPSRYEPWGLVVNEAMAAGLPVVADRKCGAAMDLVVDGRSGRLLPELTVDALAEAMTAYRDDSSTTAAHGRAALDRVQAWSFDRTVDGFLNAFRAADRTESVVSARRPVLLAGGRNA